MPFQSVKKMLVDENKTCTFVRVLKGWWIEAMALVAPV